MRQPRYFRLAPLKIRYLHVPAQKIDAEEIPAAI